MNTTSTIDWTQVKKARNLMQPCFYWCVEVVVWCFCARPASSCSDPSSTQPRPLATSAALPHSRAHLSPLLTCVPSMVPLLQHPLDPISPNFLLFLCYPPPCCSCATAFSWPLPYPSCPHESAASMLSPFILPKPNRCPPSRSGQTQRRRLPIVPLPYFGWGGHGKDVQKTRLQNWP